MHPILSEKRFFGLYLVAWFVGGVLLGFLLHTAGGLTLLSAFMLALPMAMVYSFMCLASYYLCRAFPFHRFDAARLLIIHSIAALLTSSLWVSIGTTWASLVSQIPSFETLETQYPAEVPLILAVGAISFLLSVAVNYAVISWRDSREAEKQAMDLRFHAQEAELRALRSQINPHFLFNSLNSISALTASDPQSARTMTLLLADFLRRSLSLGSKQFVPLEEELALTQNFLAIEQVRFGDRLSVETRIPDDALRSKVPPLILQPLIENAVNHGIAHLLYGGRIVLAATRSRSRLKVSVENPCDPDRPLRKGHGIGIDNVRSRLKALYGPEARIDIDAVPSLFRIELSFPAPFTVPADDSFSEMQVSES